jgi:hypothetical protein
MIQFRNSQYYITKEGVIYNSITKRTIRPYIKKFKKSSNYYCVMLHLDKKQKHFLLHRILAECFIPNLNNLPQINHKDGNSLNNNLSNLEWSSALNNNLHAINTGLRPTKLNKELADKIRQEYNSNKITQKTLALKYSVGTTIINKIVNNISWK